MVLSSAVIGIVSRHELITPVPVNVYRAAKYLGNVWIKVLLYYLTSDGAT